METNRVTRFLGAPSVRQVLPILIRTLAALTISLYVLTATSALAGPPPGKPEAFHLYLLIGQSNMAGRGEIEEIDQTPHPRVWKLTQDNAWQAATAPIHFDKPKIAGTGLAGSFGRSLANEQPGIHIGLIPCAVGGTRISQWKKGAKLYNNAVSRAKAAMKDGVLKGILWHQGEGDSGKESTLKAYIPNLTRLVHHLRADLDSPTVPFIAGQLSRAWGDEKPLRKEFNIQLARHARFQTIPYFGVALSQDISAKADKTHFDAAGLRELGKRYFEAWKDAARVSSNLDPGATISSIRFQGHPVSQAVSVLATRAHVPYAADLDVLESPIWTSPYYAEFRDVTAGRALRAMLAQIGLVARQTPGSNLQRIGKSVTPAAPEATPKP